MKIIILDRDGVINYDSDEYIKNVDEWEFLPNSLEAISRLNGLGFTIIVCTNQSGITRGLFSVDELNKMHEKMHKAIRIAGGEIAAIFVCPHIAEDNCECRKPKTKMLNDICERFNIDDTKQLMMVGDSKTDLEAISQIGGIPILVKTGKGKNTFLKGQLPTNTLVFKDLLDFTDYLINKEEDNND